MKKRSFVLGTGFRVFYCFSAFVGTLSSLFWVERVIRQGLMITSIWHALFFLWDLSEFVLTVSVWLIPYAMRGKEVSISLIRLAPVLVMSSVVLRIILTLLFAAA